jgi:hypothetical protein
MIVPMKTRSYYTDDLAMILSGIMGFFFLLMYIPPLYRTVYRIVDEKESRAKESMFMMGLKPSQYWLSWLSYYTFVNFVITTTSWIPLYCYVLRNTNWLIMWLTIFLFG